MKTITKSILILSFIFFTSASYPGVNKTNLSVDSIIENSLGEGLSKAFVTTFESDKNVKVSTLNTYIKRLKFRGAITGDISI